MSHTHSHSYSNQHLRLHLHLGGPGFEAPDGDHNDMEIPTGFSFGGIATNEHPSESAGEPDSHMADPFGTLQPSPIHNPIPYDTAGHKSDVPYPTPSEKRPTPVQTELRPLVIILVGTLPVLVAFPSMFLSRGLAYVGGSGSFSDQLATASVLVFLAFVFLLMVRFLLGFVKTLVALSGDVPSNARLVVYLVGALTAVYVASSMLSINRISVLLLGLYLNQYNPYTLVGLVVDMYNGHDIYTGTITMAAYVLVIVAFKVLFKRFVLSSISSTIASMDYLVLLLGLAASGIAMVVSGQYASISLAIIGVNIAASLVFIVSLYDCDLKASPIIPGLLSILSFTLEYVMEPKSMGFSTLVDLATPFLIKADRSYDIPAEEALEAFVSTSIIKELLRHSDTRAIFNFLLLNTTFMFIQLLYSFRSKSLGLLSDSLHMALDCTSLALGLIAGILSKNKINANGKFPFGLKNFEILAGFTNGTLLVGISGSIVFEAIGRLWNPIVLQKTNELIIVSILGLLVNLVGIFAFNHGHDHGHGHGHSHGIGHSHETTEKHSHEHSHDDSHEHSHSHSHSNSHNDTQSQDGMNDNMKGIFLHILADTLGSVGVVISTILTKIFHWDGFDPIASIIIAVLIFLSAIPLIKSTGSTLLLKLTNDKETKIRTVLNDITQIRGIKSFTTPRFWPNSANTINGYIHIQVYRGENIQMIKKQCEKLFVAEGIDVMIQMENDYDDCWCRSSSDIKAI